MAGTHEESVTIIILMMTNKKEQLTFTQGSLCAAYHCKCFAYVISSISLSILKRMILFLVISPT